MRLRTRVVLQLAALFLALGASALADSNAYLYIVHGIPGRDLADNFNPGLPVDVLINGKSCLIHGLTFGNTSGPFTLAAGTYDVQISLANTLAPCTNAVMIDSQVILTAGESVSAVAAISGTEPALLQFTDDLLPVAPGNGRFVLINSADAPTLQATLTQVGVKNPKTFTVSASPDAQAAIGVPAGNYLVQITAAGSTTVLTSEQINLADQSVTLSYASGEALNNSVGLVNRVIRDVF
ncbi:MAG: DUF4397 domain-containing protein [Isosphaeraceae bacterium]|jgi:uncharacterized protein DUF4397